MLETPLHLVATLADRELHRRLLHDAVVDAFKEAFEEPQLVTSSLLGIKRMHVGAGVDAKFLVWSCGAHEGFGDAAQMQSHAGPIAHAEHRYRDLVPLRLRAPKGPPAELLA